MPKTKLNEVVGVSLTLPAKLLTKVDEFAENNFMTRSEVLRLAVSAFIQDPSVYSNQICNGLENKMFKQTELDAFWLFIAERQNVFYKRKIKHMPGPWTDDPVIQQARFTNVYRELDRGTKFCIENIQEDMTVRSLQEMVILVTTYRFFNRIDTFKEIRPFVSLYMDMPVDDYNIITDGIEEALQMRRKFGQKIYTGAYMASYCPNMGGRSKEHNAALVIENIARQSKDLAELMVGPKGTVRGLYDFFIGIKGFGRFLAYQCALDFTYPLIRKVGEPLARNARQSTWSKAGPGAEEGLRILGIDTIGDAACNKAMRTLTEMQVNKFKELGLDMKWMRDNNGNMYTLSLSNIENCLCEFQKWWRMLGGGHVKTIFSKLPTEEWQSNVDTIPWYGEWNDDKEGKLIVL